MYPKISQAYFNRQLKKQHGSMLILAIFVIIVLGLLGVALTKLLSSTSETVVYEVLGQRALNAARAGIECKISKQFPISDTIKCSQSDTKDFSGVPGLENCSYITSSENVTVLDGTNSYTYTKFTGVGQCSAGDIFVSRTIYIDALESE